MNIPKSFAGTIFAAVYAALVLLAAYQYTTCKPGPMIFDFCGVPLLFLTLPVFLPLSIIFETLGFGAPPDVPLMIAAAIVCAAALYVAGAVVERLFRKYFRKFR